MVEQDWFVLGLEVACSECSESGLVDAMFIGGNSVPSDSGRL